MNLTVTQPTAPGSLRAYPGGAALPIVSATNYGAGQTRANNVEVGLGAGGTLVIRSDQNSGNVQVIIDVNGYYQ
jgi:hypothetical protein